MVAFKYQKTDKREYLVTVSNSDDALDSGIKHVVLRPVTGSFAEKHPSMFDPLLDHWWKDHEENSSGSKAFELVLRSSHHKDMTDVPSFPTLRARLADSEVEWSVHPRLGFEFSYIPYYWEWLEDIVRNCRTPLRAVHLLDAVYASLFLYECDTSLIESVCEHWCPKTNTLVTALGEASISLWDLRSIAGLPVTGLFYDEVVPSYTELLHSDKDGRPHLPPSCKYLFSAYHRILSRARGKVKVTFEDWCRFWFKGKSVYSVSGRDPRLPIPKKDFSCYGKVQSWDDNIHSVFQTLNIPEADRRSTYLAAFFSCWLCAFALPVRDLGYIRPSVFKAASLLAGGQTISLAIPVLASIYRGLNDISTSVSPGGNPTPFALHYVYAWLASYYHSHKVVAPMSGGALMISFRGQGSVLPPDFHDAQEFIYSPRNIDWRFTSLGGSKDEKHNDDPRLSRQSGEFFIALRSCYLTLRHENDYVIEPYSPHRFARQFGFLQDLPGELERDVRDGNRERMFQYFESSVRLGTKSKFVIPRIGSSSSSRTSSSFEEWWGQITPTLFGAKTSRFIDDHCVEKSLSTGAKKRKPENAGASPSPSYTSAAEAKRHMKIKIRPHVETTPASADKNFQVSENFVKGGRCRSSPSSDQPLRAQNRKDRSPVDNILDILEDDVPDVDDSSYFTVLKDDMNVDAEVAASNLPSNDFTDQDLADACNDSVIYQAATSLMSKDILVEASPPKTSISDVQDVLRQADRHGAIFAINSLREKLVNSPISDFSNCEKEMEQYFQYVATRGVETSILQAQVKKYLSVGLELQSVRHSFLDKPSILQSEERLSTVNAKFSMNTSLEKQECGKAESIRESLRTTLLRRDELNKELAELGNTEVQLKASLTLVENACREYADSAKGLLSEKTTLEDFLALSNKELRRLQDLEKKFAAEQAILKDLAWSS